ncbi:MAG: PucR family transcriptional regulator [Actinomycetales bacterium]
MGNEAAEPEQIRFLVADVVESVVARAAVSAVETIFAQVSAYRDNPDRGLRQDLDAHCRNIFSVLALSLREQRPAEPQDFPFTAQIAVRRLEQGIGLTDFMRAYRLAQASLWEELRARLGADAQLREVALDMVGIVMQVIEAGSQAAASAYLEAEQHRVADHDRVRRDLIEDLLAGRQPVIASRLALVRGLGLAGQVRFQLVSAAPEQRRDSGDALRTAAAGIRRELGRPARGLIALRQGEVVAVIPSRVEDDLAAAMRRATTALAPAGVELRIGISTAHTGLRAGPVAYSEAGIARRASTAATPVVSLDALTPGGYLALREDPTARRLIRPPVRRFVEQDVRGGSELIGTVLEYIRADLNATQAAARLGVHVNTVYHRLDRISERTGCDLRRFGDVEELLTAIRLLVPGVAQAGLERP